MTDKEALEYFKRRKELIGLSDRVQRAEALAIKALEKQIPSDVEKLKIGNVNWGKGTKVYHCPNCNNFISRIYGFCYKCGQAIDWGEKE